MDAGGAASTDQLRIHAILEEVRKLAIEYHQLTGKPLGVTGEMAEVEAARLLGLELCDARQSGFDATRVRGEGPSRVQIKGRRLLNAKPGQQIGSIRLNHEWDSVMLVLLDEQFRATAIYEAERTTVEAALTAPGPRARNERGALAVGKFKSSGHKVWPAEV